MDYHYAHQQQQQPQVPQVPQVPQQQYYPAPQPHHARKEGHAWKVFALLLVVGIIVGVVYVNRKKLKEVADDVQRKYFPDSTGTPQPSSSPPPSGGGGSSSSPPPSSDPPPGKKWPKLDKKYYPLVIPTAAQAALALFSWFLPSRLRALLFVLVLVASGVWAHQLRKQGNPEWWSAVVMAIPVLWLVVKLVRMVRGGWSPGEVDEVAKKIASEAEAAAKAEKAGAAEMNRAIRRAESGAQVAAGDLSGVAKPP